MRTRTRTTWDMINYPKRHESMAVSRPDFPSVSPSQPASQELEFLIQITTSSTLLLTFPNAARVPTSEQPVGPTTTNLSRSRAFCSAFPTYKMSLQNVSLNPYRRGEQIQQRAMCVTERDLVHVKRLGFDFLLPV